MAEKLTISVEVASNCPVGEKDSRTTRLLEQAVRLAESLHGQAVHEITIAAHDGTASVKFEPLPTETTATTTGA